MQWSKAVFRSCLHKMFNRQYYRHSSVRLGDELPLQREDVQEMYRGFSFETRTSVFSDEDLINRIIASQFYEI